MPVPDVWASAAIALGMFLGVALAVFIFLSFVPDRNPVPDARTLRFSQAEPGHTSPPEEGEMATALRDLVNFIEETEHKEKVKMEWVSDLAHDLKAPLSVIRGCAEILEHQAEVTLEEGGTACVGAIISLVDEMHGLVNGLAVIGRGQEASPPPQEEVFSLVELVVDILQPYMLQCRTRGCSFELAVPEDLCLIQADIHAVMQSLQDEIAHLVQTGSSGDKFIVQMKQDGPEIVLRVHLEKAPASPVIVLKFSA